MRLAASLSLKLSKYAKAARELTTGIDPGSPVDELRRAGVSPELSRYPSASLRERAQEVLDEGSVGCLMLVLGQDVLAPLLRLAREKGMRSVVVSRETGLARWAYVGFTWSEVITGKARKTTPSMSGEWSSPSRFWSVSPHPQTRLNLLYHASYFYSTNFPQNHGLKHHCEGRSW